MVAGGWVPSRMSPLGWWGWDERSHHIHALPRGELTLDRRAFLGGLAAVLSAVAAGRVAVLASRRPETPTNEALPAARLLSGEMAVSDYLVPEGERHRFDPGRSTIVEVSGDLHVRGTLEMHPRSGVTHVLRFSDGGEMVVSDGGRLDISGTPKAAWNRDGRHPTWSSADELVVTPIVPGDVTVRPFSPGEPVPEAGGRRAEVLNLTRDVRIEGPSRILFVNGAGPQNIRFAEVREAGIPGELGFYPIHFHLNYDSTRGSMLEGVVVRGGQNHAFVPHGSHGITLRDCIAYDTLDVPFWWDLPPAEDRSDPVNNSHDVLYENCVAAGAVHNDDRRADRFSGFLMAGGVGNAARGCVATAIRGGRDSSAFFWSGTVREGVWDFRGNLAHNNEANGIFVWENGTQPHVVKGFAAYHNRGYGISHGAYQNAFVYEDLQLDTNQEGGILLQALAKTQGMRLERVRITGSRVALDSPRHLAGAATPTLFLDCRFEAPIPVRIADQGRFASQFDFVRCGLEPPDFEIRSLLPDSIVRVEREDGTAYQITQAGVRDIPPFSA